MADTEKRNYYENHCWKCLFISYIASSMGKLSVIDDHHVIT